MQQYKAIYKYKDSLEVLEKFVKMHLLLNNIQLQEQQISVLIYFCKHGVNENTYDLLITNKIVATKQIISNCKTILRGKGLIKKVRYRKWELDSKLCLELENRLDFIVSLRYE